MTYIINKVTFERKERASDQIKVTGVVSLLGHRYLIL